MKKVKMEQLKSDQLTLVTGGIGCTFGGRSYSQGSRMMQAGRLRVCRSGRWEAR